MARRNPNGYGSVTKLKGNRSRPYVIKVTTYDEDGHGRQVPVDYAATREEANIILARYNDNPWNIDRNRVTLAELYKRWLEVKAPKLGSSRLYTHKYFQITNAQNIVFKPFVECFNTSKLPLKCYI